MAVFAAARDNPVMAKHRIFSLSAGLALALAWGPVWAQNQDPDAALRAQKLPHEQAIEAIERERLEFQKALAKREEECLKRFFSANCLDKVATDHLSEMRAFDLRREAERQAIREIDAELRARSRERKATNS